MIYTKTTITLIALVFLLSACMQPISVLSTPSVVPAVGTASLSLSATAAPSTSRAEPTQPTALLASQNCYKVIASESLHVRTKPNYQSDVTGYLAHGAMITATGAAVDGWLPVVGGWVRDLFVERCN